jgi:S-adenosylmethionine/arginine decarboxylase-like enzyme
MTNKSLIRNEIKRVLNIQEETEEPLTKAPTKEDIKKEPKEELIKKDKKEVYGKELILDIHEVEKDKITVKNIKTFAEELCDEIGMTKGIKAIVWGTDSDKDELKDPRADGLSCIQFLHSSSIVVHGIDLLGCIFINIFSCKEFSTDKAKNFALKSWGGKIASEHVIIRK